ncbi:MAG: T9SS type A sorting domain-containing protein, partial [Saprospiraceae bacterium]|nr:T9SS type A sorting domain-containing protein [Saprospiraceae bacterium]
AIAIATEFNDAGTVISLAEDPKFDPTGSGIMSGVMPPDVALDILSGDVVFPGTVLTTLSKPPGAFGSGGPFTATDGGVGIVLGDPGFIPPTFPFYGGSGGLPPAGTPILLHTTGFVPFATGTTEIAPIGLFTEGPSATCVGMPMDATIDPGTIWPGVAEVISFYGTCFGKSADAIPPSFPAISPGSVTVVTALPVELEEFEARAEGDRVLLSWTTSFEENNYGFEVQQLKDQSGTIYSEWETIGFVKGAGNSENQQSYFFQVQDVLPGTQYFRLKQVDFDGRVTLSQNRSVDIKVEQTGVLFEPFPNPSSTRSTLTVSLDAEKDIRLEIIDLNGQILQNIHQGVLPIGKTKFEIGVSEIPSGLYFVRIVGPQIREVQKLLVRH